MFGSAGMNPTFEGLAGSPISATCTPVPLAAGQSGAFRVNAPRYAYLPNVPTSLALPATLVSVSILPMSSTFSLEAAGAHPFPHAGGRGTGLDCAVRHVLVEPVRVPRCRTSHPHDETERRDQCKKSPMDFDPPPNPGWGDGTAEAEQPRRGLATLAEAPLQACASPPFRVIVVLGEP
jgi:hypothetical protein